MNQTTLAISQKHNKGKCMLMVGFDIFRQPHYKGAQLVCTYRGKVFIKIKIST